MTESKLSERGKKAAKARWGIRAKTRAGVVKIGDLRLECWRITQMLSYQGL